MSGAPAHPGGDAHKAHRTRQAGAKFDKKKAKDKTKRELTQQHKNPRVSERRGRDACACEVVVRR